MPHLSKAIAACLKSFKDQPGDIDVGRFLSGYLSDLGMETIHTRPMLKMAQPHELTWNWPRSFYHIYFPKLAEMGFLTDEEVRLALDDMHQLTSNPNAQLCCPSLIEVIAEKPAD
jgi:hypothetical protein